MTAKFEMEFIERRIYSIRGQRVMLSHHLAKLYGVETKVLIQTVKRNIERFPNDFMFKLENKELAILKSQIVTSSCESAGSSRSQFVTLVAMGAHDCPLRISQIVISLKFNTP